MSTPRGRSPIRRRSHHTQSHKRASTPGRSPLSADASDEDWPDGAVQSDRHTDRDTREGGPTASGVPDFVKAFTAVQRAFDAYILTTEASGTSVRPTSANRASCEFHFSIQCRWDAVAFLECLHAQGAVGYTWAEPKSLNFMHVCIGVTEVGQVDLVRIAKDSVHMVQASPLCGAAVFFLVILVAWLALHLSSFDHLPWTVPPLRWGVETWRGSSSS